MDDAFPTPVPLNGQLCFALYGASIAMGRVYKPMLDALGLTFPQYLVLQVLWERDGRTVGALAERLSLEPSTITPLVKRLEASGLVTRKRAADDERRVHVTLTDRGQALRADSVCISEQVIAKTQLALPELKSLTDQIQSLRRALASDG